MHNLRKRFTNGGSQMVATIKDVAKKANVSISTVSRVLSNQMHVSSSTYKRIQDAVAELNYIPNSSAVSLVKKSSTTVLYADSFYKGRPYENPHMFYIISGSSHELRKKGYFLNCRSYVITVDQNAICFFRLYGVDDLLFRFFFGTIQIQ